MFLDYFFFYSEAKSSKNNLALILQGNSLGKVVQCLKWRCRAITTKLYFDVSQDGTVTCFSKNSQEEMSKSMPAKRSRISQHLSSRFQTNEIYFSARIIKSLFSLPLSLCEQKQAGRRELLEDKHFVVCFWSP